MVTATLAVGMLREERPWPDELIPRLRLLAAVFASVLARQEAERAVRESEERFRRMADSAPMMVWLSGLDGRRTYVNQRWLDFTGRSLGHELGETWAESVHPDDWSDLERTLASALATERPFTMEYRLRRRDGEFRWVLDHGTPRRSDDGALLGYVGSAVDVTQLRVAQRALLETDLLRSAIFGALYGHVAALDKRGRIIAVNRAWGRFALENGGNPVQVSVGANYLDVCRDAAEAGDHEAGRILDALRKVLAGGTPLQLEYVWRTPVGERWFEMTAQPLRRPEGETGPRYHVDVTRRRQAEGEAERQREELAHVLRTTTLGELAASLAHEINQPLAAIVANAQATRRLLDAAGLAPRRGRGPLGHRGGRQARLPGHPATPRLFRREHVDRHPVDVNELVHEVVRLLRHDTERSASPSTARSSWACRRSPATRSRSSRSCSTCCSTRGRRSRRRIRTARDPDRDTRGRDPAASRSRSGTPASAPQRRSSSACSSTS